MVYFMENPILLGGLEHELFFIFTYIGNVIIPTDELIFFRGVGQPPTSNIWSNVWYLRLAVAYKSYYSRLWYINHNIQYLIYNNIFTNTVRNSLHESPRNPRSSFETLKPLSLVSETNLQYIHQKTSTQNIDMKRCDLSRSTRIWIFRWGFLPGSNVRQV